MERLLDLGMYGDDVALQFALQDGHATTLMAGDEITHITEGITIRRDGEHVFFKGSNGKLYQVLQFRYHRTTAHVVVTLLAASQNLVKRERHREYERQVYVLDAR